MPGGVFCLFLIEPPEKGFFYSGVFPAFFRFRTEGVTERAHGAPAQKRGAHANSNYRKTAKRDIGGKPRHAAAR
jgi:hypothetical protein